MASEETSPERHMFQATYSGNLQLAIRNIITAFDTGDLVRAFRGCETLRNLLPKLWEDIDNKIYKKVCLQIAKETNSHMQAQSISIQRTGVRNAIDSIKRNYASEFFQTIITLMEKHNYLDLGWTPASATDFEKLEKEAQREE